MHITNIPMKLNLKTCGYTIGALTLMPGRYPISQLLSDRHAKKLHPKTDLENYSVLFFRFSIFRFHRSFLDTRFHLSNLFPFFR